MIRRMVPNLAASLRLLLITDEVLLGARDLVATCRAAVLGGVSCVELRDKRLPVRERLGRARALVAALPVPVLVNDRLDVALAAGAAGVHLGPEDLPVRLARRIAPAGFLIGASVGTPEEVAGGQEADYWGIGPWRGSPTKPDAGAALGAEGFRRLRALAGGRPCLAIGGVRPEDLPAIRAAGGSGVAVVSGILSAADVTAAARRYARALAD
jgi:thiamine-phosphate pyrophosphorylase